MIKKINSIYRGGKPEAFVLVLYHNLVTGSEEQYLSWAAALFTHHYCQRGIKP